MDKKKVELNIPAGLKDEPFFYNLIKEFEVIVNIQEASFSTDTGWALVTLQAQEAEFERLFAFLEKKGVRVTVH